MVAATVSRACHGQISHACVACSADRVWPAPTVVLTVSRKAQPGCAWSTSPFDDGPQSELGIQVDKGAAALQHL